MEWPEKETGKTVLFRGKFRTYVGRVGVLAPQLGVRRSKT